jgi:ElaB/YqjD/DUF883 family membrane-anchored ribosome-binding protein
MNDVKTNLKSLGDKADDIRKHAADTLESAAESVRAAGNNVRKTCVNSALGKQRMLGGFRGSVRRNPLRSLALATAVGVLAGFSCRRQTGT